MSTGFAFEQSLHLRSVSNLRIFLVFSYGILKLAFRARKLSGAFEKRAPGERGPGDEVKNNGKFLD